MSLASAAVRVRFAPSPTGTLHLGGLRTALYNALFALKHDGAFLLRIEDTDQRRLVPGAAAHLQRVLTDAFGFRIDEGPYFQSERLALYADHAEQLVERGAAYPCFCSEERLGRLRAERRRAGVVTAYDRFCSFLPAEEARARRAAGEPHVIRMRVPDEASTVVEDRVWGAVSFANKSVDDSVLVKSDGFPTYHLANVVDDHTMRISDVIRGEEWLSSTAKHVHLYRALEWELPAFHHLPLLLNRDRTKLSKRQGDVSAEAFLERGFLPSALLHFLADPVVGSDAVFGSLEALATAFDLGRVQKAGSVCDEEKLRFLNAEHIRWLAADEARLERLARAVPMPEGAAQRPANDAYLQRVLRALAQKLTTTRDFAAYADYFFSPPNLTSDEACDMRARFWDPELVGAVRDKLSLRVGVVEGGGAVYETEVVTAVREKLEVRVTRDAEATVKEAIAAVVRAHDDESQAQKRLLMSMRFALSGRKVGPGVATIAATLGLRETVKRLEHALAIK